jgi:hypothetical protein
MGSPGETSYNFFLKLRELLILSNDFLKKFDLPLCPVLDPIFFLPYYA